MKDLKFSVFDLFSYSLPGGILLVAFLLLSPEIGSARELTQEISKISLGLGIILIFLAYIVGNAIDTFGSWIYYKIGTKIWGSPEDENAKMSTSKQRALIREFSPENHIYIQQWKVVKTMSHNLSFSFLILGVFSIIKVIVNKDALRFDFISLIILSLIFCIVFLNRASIFDKWHYKDLTSVTNSLHLQKRALKIISDVKVQKD